jgi:phosphatidylglycerol lysyltransferase
MDAATAPDASGRDDPSTTVRAIVRRRGYNTTSYQILNPGFSFWIDETLDAAVGYVDRHGVRVVGGAPVCADERLDQVMQAFERDAARYGRDVVYFCAEDRVAELAARDAMRTTFPIGAQPFWRPDVLLHEFATHTSLRAQLSRARNKQISVREAAALDAFELHALERCLAEWMEDRPLPPLHFLIETQTLAHLEDRRLIVAERAGAPIGFLVATPIPARNGWLVEQIVRGKDAPNGTAELLLHHAALVLRRADASLITLGLAPLAHRAEPIVDRSPRWLRVMLGALRTHGRTFYNFAGLESFKAKFRGARWAPVYASLAPGTSLPRALLAVTAAFSGEPLRRFIPRTLARALLLAAASRD